MEEAAGVGQYRRIGQFAAADLDHCRRDLPGIRVGDLLLIELASQIGVTGQGLPGFRQAESHVRDHPRTVEVPALLFEDAVAVGKTAGCAIEVQRLAALHVAGFERQETIGDFQAVGADVLDRRCADRAGNQCQIFEARPALRECPAHQLMPVLAGSGAHIPGVVILGDQLPATNCHVQQQTVEVAAEYQVAAPSENKAARPVAAGELRQLSGSGDLGIKRGPAGQSQCCPRRQFDVTCHEIRQWPVTHLAGNFRAAAPASAVPR
ncbi:MAG: Arsenate reductase, glutaredoxin family [Candidatus Accumulibacter vicinus]|uniref:Arsenate reductase, glutaredoxin family n=1 Tax=Candidatus Accumulibacter vicinus TaxID=2954382 RepID=A0A084XWY9_9PROT|nr:MAG: Arsenate reductase, glutaredoxin family [Candidatus Accumulibacter vicinus]